MVYITGVYFAGHISHRYTSHGRVYLMCLFRGHFWMALGWPFWGGGWELTRDTRGWSMKAAELDGEVR